MADIVGSLFGITPQMFGEQQRMSALNEGIALAQLDPASRGAALTYGGAKGLGTAIGGAMGVEDPQLKMISTRNAIAQQIDQTNPESILKGAQMLAQAGDQQGAMALAQYARQAQGELAQVQQRKAATLASLAAASRERVQASPKEVQLAQARALLVGPEGSPEYNTEFASVLKEQMTKPDQKISYGPEADRAAVARFGKPFSQLTQQEASVIDTLLEERGVKKAKEGASKLVLPGEKALVDIPAFTRNVQQTIEKPLNAIYQVDNALANIQDAIKTDNFASYRAAQTQFAKAIAGAGDLSQKELKAAGADPALVGGAADYLSTLATSTPTKDTMQKMQSAMQTIKKVNTNKANNELERQRKIAISAGYPTEAVNLALSFPELTAKETGGEKKANTRTLKSGKVVTVIEE
jgi:hypothetical protein